MPHGSSYPPLGRASPKAAPSCAEDWSPLCRQGSCTRCCVGSQGPHRPLSDHCLRGRGSRVPLGLHTFTRTVLPQALVSLSLSLYLSLSLSIYLSFFLSLSLSLSLSLRRCRHRIGSLAHCLSFLFSFFLSSVCLSLSL